MMKKNDLQLEVTRIVNGDNENKKRWLVDVIATCLYKYISLEDLKKGFTELPPEVRTRYQAQAQIIDDTEVLRWVLEQVDKDAFSRIYFKNERETGQAMLYTTEKIRGMMKELVSKKKKYTPLTR